jgi:hypothetical protein
MLLDPFSHEPKITHRQRPPENLPGRDLDLGPLAAMAGVKVRRRMIAVVHLDHDSKEAADARHTGITVFGRT